MKHASTRIIALIAVTLLGSFSVFAEDAVSNPAAKAFDISLPQGFGEFSTQTQKAESPDGTVETTNWISRAPSGEAIVVTVSKMPGQILNPDKLMASTRDSLLKSLGATLEEEKDLEGNATLLQFKGDKQAVFLKSQLVVEADRLYQVLYVGRTAEQRAAPAIDALFSSFKVAH